MERLKPIITCLLLLMIWSCKNDKHHAYIDFQKKSAKGGHDAKDSPYLMNSMNETYRMESYPYRQVNLSFGDLCSGITKVFRNENDSLLYTIDRFFAVNNTYLNEDGTVLVYINNFWRGSDYDSCSTNILEFYKDGVLDVKYSYSELFHKEPKGEDYFWLELNYRDHDWLTRNHHYLLDEELYLITNDSGQVIIFDLNDRRIKEKTDTSIFLNNLELVEFQPNKIEFFKKYEIDSLPNTIKSKTFRQTISENLKVEIVSFDEKQDNEKLYFNMKVEAFIDSLGNCRSVKVSSHEHVLTELSDSLRKEISALVLNHKFKIDTIPFELEYWFYKDQFYLSRNPKSLSISDLENYRNKVCEIDTIKKEYIPKDLTDAHFRLDEILDDSTKIFIQQGNPSHMGLGLWIRNNWGLWKGGRLGCYFAEKELSHPDHISGLIIYSYQLKLNHKKIDQDSLILEYAEAEKKWLEGF